MKRAFIEIHDEQILTDFENYKDKGKSIVLEKYSTIDNMLNYEKKEHTEEDVFKQLLENINLDIRCNKSVLYYTNTENLAISKLENCIKIIIVNDTAEEYKEFDYKLKYDGFDNLILDLEYLLFINNTDFKPPAESEDLIKSAFKEFIKFKEKVK